MTNKHYSVARRRQRTKELNARSDNELVFLVTRLIILLRLLLLVEVRSFFIF